VTPAVEWRSATRETERIVRAEIAKLPSGGSFEEVPSHHHAWDLDLLNRPERAWRSRLFIVQLYPCESGAQRLSIQRTGSNAYIRASRRDERPISWDELMAVKAAIGFDTRWAVEVFPPDRHVVNVANMRHIWLLDEAPAYAWRRS
jgi:hypothetical protein